MRMAVEKPDPHVFSYKFQGIFNTSLFTGLAVHTETKLIKSELFPPFSEIKIPLKPTGLLRSACLKMLLIWRIVFSRSIFTIIFTSGLLQGYTLFVNFGYSR